MMGTNILRIDIQAAWPQLRSAEGSIVNIVDIHARRPLRNYAVYGAAKAALAMLTRSLAREMAPTVRVNGVAPGAILWPEDDMTDAVRNNILAQEPQSRYRIRCQPNASRRRREQPRRFLRLAVPAER